MLRGRVHWLGCLLVAGLLLVPGALGGQSGEDPALAGSMLVSPPTARAGQRIPFTMVFRSDADGPAEVSFWADLGDRILYGGSGDGTGLRFDAAARRLTWRGTIPPRGEQRLEFAVVAPLWTGGTGLVVQTGAHREGELNGIRRNGLVHVLEPRLQRTAGSILVGPVILGPNEFVILGALLAALVIGFGLRRRLSKYALAAAFACFLLLAVVGLLLADGARMLVTDIRMLTSWAAVPCTVVDAAAVYQASSSSGSLRGQQMGGRSYAPLAVVRFRAEGTERTAVGFWSESHILVSRRAARLVAPYRPGTATTCWVDPHDRDRFVLIRRPGFGHVTLLVVLTLIGGAAWLGMRLRVRAAAGPRKGRRSSPSPP